MIFDPTRDNGFVQLRRNILCHLESRKITLFEYVALTVLFMTVSSSTGETMTCASAISQASGKSVSEDDMQRALRGLESKGYIRRYNKPGVRGIYKIVVNKFLLTTGSNAGKLTQITPKNRTESTREQKPGVATDETGESISDKAMDAVAGIPSKQCINVEPVGCAATVRGWEDIPDHLPDPSTQVQLSAIAIQERYTELEIEGRKTGEEEGSRHGLVVPESYDRDSPSAAEISAEERAHSCSTTSQELLSQDPAHSPSTEASPSDVLAHRYLELLKQPPQFRTAVPTWGEHFSRLLQRYNYEDLLGAMNWAFEVDAGWPQWLFRRTGDPVEYFASRIDKIIAGYNGWKQGEANRIKVPTVPHRGAKAKPKPQMPIKVCQTDALEEFMKQDQQEAQ